MNATGWRTIVLDSRAHISMHDGCILIQGEEEMELPLSQIGMLVIANEQCTITGSALNELSSQGSGIIMCNSKRNPSCEILSLDANTGSAGCIMEQTHWPAIECDRVWAAVVQAKIKNQIALLDGMDMEKPAGMEKALLSIKPGDPDNREGQAARYYFKSLFGKTFRRHAPDTVNAALNYGYAILCSIFSRYIVSHGYHPALGIHHCSKSNRLNLSYDLMEPFRPFVDKAVWNHKDQELDWQYKKDLLGIMHLPCTYGKHHMKLQNAAELFTLDVLKAMAHPNHTLKEVGFE